MMRTSGLAAVALSAMVAPINAIGIELFPEPTGGIALPARDWSPPEPTAAPVIPENFNFARADNGLSVLVAPDNTCGYVSGLQGAHYSCIGDYSCALIPGSGSSTGNVGCCNTKACTVRKACVDYKAYYSSSSCDDACRVDAFTVKCISSDMPYCNTISFSGDIVDYWCNNVAIATAQEAFTTYSGGPNRNYKTTALFATSSSSSSSSSRSSSSTSSSSSASSSSTTGSDKDNSSDSDNNKSSSGPPIGAIVGGVVGGVAAIGIIGIIIWLILRKKRSGAEKAAAGTPAAGSPAYTAPPPGPPPTQGNGAYPPVSQVPPQPYNPDSGFYDPKFVAAGAQPQGPYSATSQYPQNGGYFPAYGQPPSSTSPTLDPRSAVSGTSPNPSNLGYTQPPPTIHEAPANPAHANRGPMHELA